MPTETIRSKVVAKLEADPVGDALAARALAAHLELLLGKRDAEHLAGAGLGERQREPAPAGADVEHPHAGLEQQLRREMALLVRLRLLEILVRMGEVGAAVLPVAVEKQVVQPIRQVVMMGDVGLGPADRIVLVQMAQEVPADLEHAPGRGGIGVVVPVGRADVHEIVERALLDRERAVHVGLAEMEVGIERQPVMQRPVVQADRRARTVVAAGLVAPAIGIDDRQPAPVHDSLGDLLEQHRDHVLRARRRETTDRLLCRLLGAKLNELPRWRQMGVATPQDLALIDVRSEFCRDG
jgi:hypothetical protein